MSNQQPKKPTKKDLKMLMKILSRIEVMKSKDYPDEDRLKELFKYLGSGFIDYENYGWLFHDVGFAHYQLNNISYMAYKFAPTIEEKFPQYKQLIHLCLLTALGIPIDYQKIEDPHTMYKILVEDLPLNNSMLNTLRSFPLVNNLSHPIQQPTPQNLSRDNFLDTVKQILPKDDLAGFNASIKILLSIINNMDDSTFNTFAESVLILLYEENDNNKVASLLNICKPFSDKINPELIKCSEEMLSFINSYFHLNKLVDENIKKERCLLEDIDEQLSSYTPHRPCDNYKSPQ